MEKKKTVTKPVHFTIVSDECDFLLLMPTYRAPLIGGPPGCVNAAGKLSQKW